MATQLYARMRILVVVFALAGLLQASASEQPATSAAATDRGASMNHRATGPFEVKLNPQKPDNPQAEGAGIGRMSIDKRFHGDLDASSQGEMISFRTAEPTSAGYVAIERVTGSLHGRKGSFVLQHSGSMNRGAQSLSIMVVPDTGTDELAGLSGTLSISIIDGQHFYDFIYSLPEQERMGKLRAAG